MKITSRWLHLYITSFLLLLTTAPALAQEEVGGKMVSQQDWLNFMPAIIGSIVIVLLVNAFFILPILRKNDQKDKEEEA